MGLPGAAGAVRLAGFAQRGPQIHKSLVEITGALAVQQLLRKTPKMSAIASRRLLKSGQPRQNAFDVAIENREGPVKGRTQNAACGAAANAGERQPGFELLRPPLALKLTRRLVQPPRP